MNEDLFMGQPYRVWSELQKRADQAGFDWRSLLREIVELQGKVSFYESRIKQMANEAGFLPVKS